MFVLIHSLNVIFVRGVVIKAGLHVYLCVNGIKMVIYDMSSDDTG